MRRVAIYSFPTVLKCYAENILPGTRDGTIKAFFNVLYLITDVTVQKGFNNLGIIYYFNIFNYEIVTFILGLYKLKNVLTKLVHRVKRADPFWIFWTLDYIPTNKSNKHQW